MKSDIKYKPGKDQMALFPNISGNTVNGLNESIKRSPTILYWADPDTIPHGPLQNYFEEIDIKWMHMRKESASMEDRRGPKTLNSIAPNQQQDKAKNWTRKVKEFALANEADMVGIARVKPEWVYEGKSVNEKWIIVVGIAMDHKEFSKVPNNNERVDSADEVSKQYNRGCRASKALTNWIRDMGWQAEAKTGPSSGDILIVPPAVESGLGQLGKHGSVINDEYGASIRFAAVTTDLPLLADEPRDIGVDDFCIRCQVCRMIRTTNCYDYVLSVTDCITHW